MKKKGTLSIAEHLTAFLPALIDAICSQIEAEPLCYVETPGKDFTRKRKLTLPDTIKTIIGMSGGSLNKCLYELFSDKNLMTASALIQQRSKIRTEAFKSLFNNFNHQSEKYDTATFLDHHLYAVDGTVLNIPRNKNSDSFMPNFGEKGINQLHINFLYDIFCKTYKDVIIQPQPKQNENLAARQMFTRNAFTRPSIVMLDRGYGSYALFETVNRTKNLDYVCRVTNDSFTKAIGDLPLQELDVDKTVEIRTTQTNADKELFRTGKALWLPGPSKFGKKKKGSIWPFESPCKVSMRVVRFQLSSGEYETIITSLPREQFHSALIKELYQMRWGIETSFRQLKYDVGLINLHSKKEQFIIQEIYAKLLLFNFTMRIATSVEIKAEKERKYTYQINYKMAFTICRDLLRGKAPPDFVALMASYITPIREGRHDERKLRAKGFIAFQYRVAA